MKSGTPSPYAIPSLFLKIFFFVFALNYNNLQFQGQPHQCSTSNFRLQAKQEKFLSPIITSPANSAYFLICQQLKQGIETNLLLNDEFDHAIYIARMTH
jgi:hypothetical protein